MSKKPVTLYLIESTYLELKKAVYPDPVSNEVDTLIKRRLAELEGREFNPKESANYEELNNQHYKLVGKADKHEKILERKGEYKKLRRCALRCKVNEETLEFPAEVVKCMLDAYEGHPENVHLYIRLMEIIKEKREVERQLTEIRLSPA